MARKKKERTRFERARDAFAAAPKARTRTTVRMDVCPTCGLPMECRRHYREPEQYRFEGICTANADHNLERFGYYSTESGN